MQWQNVRIVTESELKMGARRERILLYLAQCSTELLGLTLPAPTGGREL